MKKILAAISALLLAGAFAFAEGSFFANDLELSDFVDKNIESNGFTLSANKEKEVRVKKIAKTAADGTKFSKVIDLRGKPVSGARTITFTANAGETITVYGNSGSKTDVRTIAVKDSSGSSILEIPAAIYLDDVTSGSVKAPATGTYTVSSVSGGMYIYGITVK